MSEGEEFQRPSLAETARPADKRTRWKLRDARDKMNNSAGNGVGSDDGRVSQTTLEDIIEEVREVSGKKRIPSGHRRE